MNNSGQTAMDERVISERHDHLRSILGQSDLKILAINPGPTLTYLTGLHFHLSERPVVLLFPQSGTPSLILPELEMLKVNSASFELNSFSYTESLDTWGPAFADGASAVSLAGCRVGIEPRALRVLELRLLERASTGAVFVSGESIVSQLRMQKDAQELDLMTRATVIAERALEATIPSVKVGVTERVIAATLIQNLLAEGSEGELPFQPIVAFGPNSANPHAVPTDYQARPGDLVLFDWGAGYEGYFSDLTRMFSLGDPEPDLRNIVEVVRRSNEAGRDRVRPDIPASEIDDASRDVIERAGFGEYFVHRTGHGLGLEVHEEPYIRGDNARLLKPGMTFTIEPGIYLDGRGGARIEDDMVVTENSGHSLSTIDRSLRILPV
jgi:Xaa-Pro aminopeptidase